MSTSIGGKMELSRGAQILAATSDGAILKQVLASHTDHLREFDVFPVINLTEKILIQAIICSTGGVLEKEERPQTTKKLSGLAELDTYNTAMLHRISLELSRACAHGYAHAKAMELLNMLSSYSWHAKVVLVLAGFAINFGKFCISVQPCPGDAISKSLAQLRKLPNLGDIFSPLKCHFDVLKKLVRASLDATKCIAELWNLTFHYIFYDKSVKSDVNALTTDAVYWIIKSTVTCSSQIDSIIRLRNEYIPSSTETCELSTLASKVNSIHEQLMNKLDVYYQYIEEKIILQSLTFPNEDNLHIDVDMGKQRGKHMLLLVSDLNILEEEIQVLDRLYRDQAMRSERLYQMVWIPVVDESSWNRSNQRKFKKLKSMMPWYSFQQPLSNEKLIELMRENWHFEDRPVVVVQDPQGKLSSTDVIRMLWIWGNLAFPFTAEREKHLWNTHIWNLETAIGDIDPDRLQLMKGGAHICFYGSENLEWIRKFTKTMKSVAKAAHISLDIVYVGNTIIEQHQNAKKKMESMIETIAEEHLSYFWSDYSSVWFFWERLDAMLASKNKNIVENHKIISVVVDLLFHASFNRSDDGWAMFFGGADFVQGYGPSIMRTLEEFKNWEENVKECGFESALRKYMQRFSFHEFLGHSGTPHKVRVVVPSNIAKHCKTVMCTKCGSSMEKYHFFNSE